MFTTKLMKFVIFYEFKEINNPEELVNQIKELFEKKSVKGTVLIAREGINGAYTVIDENHETVINYFKELGIKDFKIQETNKHQFDKTKIRFKEEILTLKQDINMNDKAEYVEAEQLKKWIDNNEVLMVDMRNDYEAKIGHFENAIKPNISRFRDLPKFVALLEQYKEKKIVTYCTGGIRCEKATAYMKKKGFKNIYQLHGGIIRYGEIVGNTHWKGKCFVFDNRLTIDIGTGAPPISNCKHCNKDSSQYAQCVNQECDKLFVVCNNCNDQLCDSCFTSI